MPATRPGRYALLRSFVLATCMTIGFAVSGRAQVISMLPRANQVSPRGTVVDRDYLRLFEPGAPWQRALSKTEVFGLPERFASTAPPNELRSIFSFLRAHGIGLSVVWHATPARGCGHRVEGMSFHPNHSLNLAKKLRRLGAPLTSIRLDAPLHFGHYYHGHDACSYTIDNLAAGVAENLRGAMQVFPEAKVLDVEPLTGLGSPSELGEWIAALRRYGPNSAPAAIIFDVQWNRPWWRYVRPMIDAVQRNGLRYGVIFNATFKERTDAEWIAAAQQHILQWNSVAPEPPAYVVFQSWNEHPSHVLPESDPTTLPYLVNWYCALASSRCATHPG